MSSAPHLRRATARSVVIGLGLVSLLGSAMATTVGAAPAGGDRPQIMMKIHGANAGHGKPVRGGTNNLTYHGGVGGIGVVTAPKVYLVYLGLAVDQQRPVREAAILQGFFNGVGGSSWHNRVTQYCQGVPVRTSHLRRRRERRAANPPGIFGGVWCDNSSAAPSRAEPVQLAAEAVSAAQHFGNTSAGINNRRSST